MKTGRSFNSWPLAVILPVLVIITGGIIIFSGISRSPGIEITLAPTPNIEGSIYVSGEVNNPGLYPVFAGDSFEDIIGAAGGIKDGADLSNIELAVAPTRDGQNTQKININRAAAWLLEALPGIGEVKAQAIIDYREENGYFHDIGELTNVAGFSDATIDKIKDLITVHD